MINCATPVAHTPRTTTEASGFDPADDEAPLDEEARSCIAERREHDRERPGDGPPTSTRMHADDDADAGESDEQADHTQSARPLAGRESECEQRDEDRHGGVRDGRDA